MYRHNSYSPSAMALAVAVCASGAALRCDAADTRLDPIVVTATRSERPVASSLAATTVITQQDIQRRRPRDVIELLKSVPGVDAVQRGGLGGESSVFLRGTNANHMLLLIDGQRVGSATLGSASLQYLDPNQIERIEIVRGPLSSLYGSDAVGGVIQVFTRKGKGASPLSLHAGVGSNNTQSHAASTGVDIGGWISSAGISHVDSEGYNRSFSELPGSEDDDAYRNTTFNISTKRAFGPHDVNFQYLRSAAETEYDAIDYCRNISGICNPYSEITSESGSIGGDYAVNDAVQLKSSLGMSKDVSTTEDDADAAVDDAFTTWRNSLLLQADWQLDANTLLSAGFDYTRDRVRGAIEGYDPVTFDPLPRVNYDRTVRGNRAWFAQSQNRIGITDLIVALRSDDNDAFGRETTGNFSIGVDVTERTRLVYAGGSAFHTPTFNDLYWPDPSGPGNPDLKPEKSVSHELRVEHRVDNASYSLAIYRTEISDLIQWQPIDPKDPDSLWTPTNIADADIEGAEFTSRHELGDVTINASYSYTRPLDADTDKQLINRTRQKLAVGVDRRWGGFVIGAEATVYGKRYMDQENLVSTPGYSMFDMHMSFDLTSTLTASMKINNLFNRDYVVIDRYREDGSSAMFAVDYKL